MEAYVSQAANQFGLDFINSSPTPVSGNLVFSPWSIINLLGMVLLGTTDKSKSHLELSKVLGIPESRIDHSPHVQLQQTHQRILDSLRTKEAIVNKSVEFEQANLILYNRGQAKLKQDYVERVGKFYSARIEDFSPGQVDKRGPVHERINRWVKNKTRGMIENIAEPSMSSNPNLLMALLNANFFAGKWQHVFEDTRLRNFYNNGKQAAIKKVNFLEHERYYMYTQFDVVIPPEILAFRRRFLKASTAAERRRAELTKGLNCRVLVLPYELNGGNEFSMVLLLPNEMDGVDALQKKLNSTVLDAIYGSLYSSEVKVRIPKFTFESNLDAARILKSMGVQTIFNPTQDLAPLFENSREAEVDQVIHKAKVIVDETGTKAASATMLAVVPTSLTVGGSTFIADHPFLFIIRHNPTNLPLFMGRVNEL